MAHSTLLASPFLHEFIKTFEFKPYRGSVMPFEWTSSWSQHSLKSLEDSLKSSELKTKLKFPFTTILPVHWIQFLSSSAQNGEDAEKGLKLEKDWLAFSSFRPGYIPKSPKILGCRSPAKIIWYSFSFIRNVSAFVSSIKFHFSNSYDLKWIKTTVEVPFLFIPEQNLQAASHEVELKSNPEAYTTP